MHAIYMLSGLCNWANSSYAIIRLDLINTILIEFKLNISIWPGILNKVIQD